MTKNKAVLERKEKENTWRQGVRDALSVLRKDLQKSEDAVEASLDLKDYKGAAQWQTRSEALKASIQKVEQLLAKPVPAPPTDDE